MKVTVVVDNCIMPKSKKPFRAEHGLSLLIETESGRFLFDTGQSEVAVYNLALLGVRPADLDAIILSHGHFDHTGGLAAVLVQAGKKLPVYCHPGAFADRYSSSGGAARYAGIPFAQKHLVSLGADFRPVEKPTELAPGLTISGSIPRVTGYEPGDAFLLAAGPDGCCSGDRDTVPDDMAIFHAGEKGLTVISGCAHSGIVNVIRHGLAVTGCSRLHAIVGGTHLGPVEKEQQEATLAELEGLQPAIVAANHCTGFYMLARLHGIFGARFVPAFVGTVLEV
ncbi:MBL fold metallo-hydrolase [Anaeroselena agilis]|uniref:MBL fold metallo-hydrolase n=1 Tax=Anaeroselena agilis TaxID=3063788 RepID=A0ABU3NVE7_9FIRM|nr:MBL fold metallo-hydrolase [Selenomonadales bacterium 4137-cl]